MRQVRKSVSFGLLRMGMEIGMRTDEASTVESLRWVMKGLTKAIIPLRLRLATNMKCAGVYRKGLVDAHFDRAIDQMTMMAHIFRAGIAGGGCLKRFRFDDSFRHLEQAYAAGKGVINIGPHMCMYPIYPAIVSPRIPCVVYLRRNKDPRKHKINQALGLAGEGEMVYVPRDASRSERLKVAIDVLRAGRLMFIATDTPRKPDQGAAVQIFGKTVYFPTGVYVMHLRTGAPVVPCVWHWADGAYHIRYGEPITLVRGRRLRQQCNDATVAWAKTVDEYLHEYPEMWWNWLDKRWTNIIRGNA